MHLASEFKLPALKESPGHNKNLFLTKNYEKTWLFRVYKYTITKGLYRTGYMGIIYKVYGEYNFHIGYVTGCLGYIGDEKLRSYVGIIKSHCKDPY